MSDKKLVEKSDIQLIAVDYQVKINALNEKDNELESRLEPLEEDILALIGIAKALEEHV